MKKLLMAFLGTLSVVFLTTPYTLACIGKAKCDGSCGSSFAGISSSTACSAQAQSCGEASVSVGMTGLHPDTGNIICPVTGQHIDDKMKFVYLYQGKTYNLCCAGCGAQFAKDPEKFVLKSAELGALQEKTN